MIVVTQKAKVKLTELQAKRFWDEAKKEKKKSFANPAKAIQALKRLP